MPHDAVIINATNDPKLLSFTTDLGRFKRAKPFRNGADVLESLHIENTTLTPEQARQLEAIETVNLTVSNCDISDEVAKSLGSIRVTGSLTLKQLRMSDQALISLGRIESRMLSLKQLRMSNQALSGLLASTRLNEVEAAEIRGCTADGWRGLSDRADLGLKISDCDFDDQALVHLSSSRCHHMQVRNAQLTGSTLGSLKTHADRLVSLSLSGCPINDKGLQTLPEFSKLQDLDLSGTLVTDEGFRNFIVPPSLSIILVGGTKVSQAWAVEFSRQHQYDKQPLAIFFNNDPRWPPKGGYCERGEFHLYK